MGLEQLLPSVLVNAIGWQSRFRRLGYAPAAAWRAAFSRESHQAVRSSRVEMIPESCRVAPGLVVDVGANRGQWLGSFLRFSNPKRVEVFEPIPAELDRAREALGHHPGVRFHPEALGAEPGRAQLKVLRQSDLTSFLEPSELLKSIYTAPELEVVTTVEVPVTTLDGAISTEAVVDILKIDVQGAERAVLRGGRDTLRRTRALLIETNLAPHYDGDDNLASLGVLLKEEHGFDLWDLSSPSHGPGGRAMWCDSVFVNSAFPWPGDGAR